MIQYKQTFDFENGWGGFVLNSSSYSAAIWSGGQGYLVVIKEAQIELQRWGKSGQEFLVVMKNDCIKDKTAANISAGAINVNGGINIFMFVDGKCVINYFDTADDMVKEGTYFTLYETAGSSIEAYDGGELPAVPAALKLSGRANEGAEYKAEFITASFGAESNEKYTYEWFFTSEKMDKLNEYALSKEEPVKKSVGTGETHKVASGEIGGYYTVTVKNEKGESVLNGVPVIVNNYDYVVSSSIVLHIDCEYALVNGTKFQIDPDDYNVAPAIADSRTLVPVRFIAESLGADVEWENDTKKITVSLGGKQIVMTLNEKSYSVDGREFELDVPAQVMYERTMVPVRVVSEAFGKNVFWDAENELIVISDEDLGIDSETESATLSYVLSRIIKRI